MVVELLVAKHIRGYKELGAGSVIGLGVKSALLVSVLRKEKEY